MIKYAIFRANGYAILWGLPTSEAEAEIVAQRVADEEGESVWLCQQRSPDDMEADPTLTEYNDGVEFKPRSSNHGPH